MKDFVTSAVFIFLAVFIFISSEGFTLRGRNAFSLGFNPAFYPRLLALVLFILSVILLIQAIRKGALKNIQIHFDAQKALKVIKLLFVVVVYIVGMTYLGYILATLICVAIFVHLFDGTKKQAALYSVGLTVALFAIFRIGFNILLPTGRIFGGW